MNFLQVDQSGWLKVLLVFLSPYTQAVDILFKAVCDCYLYLLSWLPFRIPSITEILVSQLFFQFLYFVLWVAPIVIFGFSVSNTIFRMGWRFRKEVFLSRESLRKQFQGEKRAESSEPVVEDFVDRLLDLPVDVRGIVLKHLSSYEQFALSCVNRKTRRMFSESNDPGLAILHSQMEPVYFPKSIVSGITGDFEIFEKILSRTIIITAPTFIERDDCCITIDSQNIVNIWRYQAGRLLRVTVPKTYFFYDPQFRRVISIYEKTKTDYEVSILSFGQKKFQSYGIFFGVAPVSSFRLDPCEEDDVLKFFSRKQDTGRVIPFWLFSLNTQRLTTKRQEQAVSCRGARTPNQRSIKSSVNVSIHQAAGFSQIEGLGVVALAVKMESSWRVDLVSPNGNFLKRLVHLPAPLPRFLVSVMLINSEFPACLVFTVDNQTQLLPLKPLQPGQCRSYFYWISILRELGSMVLWFIASIMMFLLYALVLLVVGPPYAELMAYLYTFTRAWKVISYVTKSIWNSLSWN